MANNENKENDSEDQKFPQLELESGKGWGSRFSDWLKRNSSLIVATIIIIVLAGGIYVYTKQSQNQPFLLEEESEQEGMTPVDELKKLEEAEKIENQDMLIDQVKEEEDAELEKITLELEDESQNENEIDLEARGTGETEVAISPENFVETAQKGQGITHLARQALRKYLERNAPDFELKPEHKIYIEDYLQNKTGDELLEVGESRSFAKTLIDEAVQKAGALSEEQITKISPYVQLASSL